MHRHTQCFCPLYRELFWENCCWVSGLGEQRIINLSRWLGYACCRDVTDLTLPEYIQGCLLTWKLKTISATLPLTSHGPWCLLGWWQNSCTAKTCGFTGIPAPCSALSFKTIYNITVSKNLRFYSLIYTSVFKTWEASYIKCFLVLQTHFMFWKA